ncbi:hypothetical protein [Ottowia sp. VDI28]|uniref:hypothetical protein n=1 Tax=Ottowia sp. VDI28 TaxID=3133968 RepID=UPI003C2E9ED7
MSAFLGREHVLNAQQQRFAAERDFYRAKVDLLLATIRLKATNGSLVEGDLMPIEQLLLSH